MMIALRANEDQEVLRNVNKTLETELKVLVEDRDAIACELEATKLFLKE
jgi:hypothetical protein